MSCFIRLRGLPWSVTHQEVLDFLENVNVVNGTKGIQMVVSRWDGKNTGEAYVEVESPEDEAEAFKLNKNKIGHRYIEIFSASIEEAEQAFKNPAAAPSNVVKLRGLPFSINEETIEKFFENLAVKRNGIYICLDRRGRPSGEAYVQFESEEDTEQALLRNKDEIGHRYIEIFRSSLAQMRMVANNRPGPYDMKDRGGFRNNNRDDFGGGNNMRDSGFGGNNRNGGFGGGNRQMGMNNSNNGFNQGGGGGGFGMFGNGGNGGGGSGGFNSGNNFNRPNNNMGMGNNSSGGGGGGMFNQGSNWNRNMGGPSFNNDNGNGNRGFNNNMNNSFGRGNGMGMGGGGGGNGGGNGMGFNNMSMALPNNNFNRNFQSDNDNDNDDLFCIHMRGLPFNAFENEVCKFFQPLRPENVNIIFNNKGLHSGTANAFFSSYDDAQLAMKKHKEQIGTRYIELFFDGKGGGNGNGVGGGNGNGNRMNGGNNSRPFNANF